MISRDVVEVVRQRHGWRGVELPVVMRGGVQAGLTHHFLENGAVLLLVHTIAVFFDQNLEQLALMCTEIAEHVARHRLCLREEIACALNEKEANGVSGPVRVRHEACNMRIPLRVRVFSANALNDSTVQLPITPSSLSSQPNA